MKKFRIKADATFWAEDIGDAFIKLSEHFKAMAEGGDPSLFGPPSSVSIRPEEDSVPIPSINISGEVIKCES